MTAANVAEYVHRVADYRLNKELAAPAAAFLRGFFEVVAPGRVAAFNQWELQALISGADAYDDGGEASTGGAGGAGGRGGGGGRGLDLEDMRRHTVYAGGYHDQGHPVVEAFWRALASFTPAQQRAFLKFATGCSRPPLLGFGALEPPLCVAMAGGALEDGGTERLPTSSACVNTLKLPPYRDAARLRDKLLYAVEAKAGFDLS